MTTLDRIAPGRAAVVMGISGDGAAGQRLFEMGMLEGESVKVVRFAPAGDPIEVELRGYLLSLRRSEAALVEVNPDGA